MDSIKEERIKELERLKKSFEQNISAFQNEIKVMERRVKECDEELVILNTNRN